MSAPGPRSRCARVHPGLVLATQELGGITGRDTSGLLRPAAPGRVGLGLGARAWGGRRERGEEDVWDEHAAFMDGLVEEGSILLGGPLEGDRETMHIIAAESEQAGRDLLRADPWGGKG